MYIVARNIVKKYGTKKALDNVTIEIEEPMIYGLLGPNGAGKTTLMNIIIGVLRPDSGEVLIKDKKITDPSIRYVIGYCPQEPALYQYLSGLDNIYFYASLYSIDKKTAREKAYELAEFLGLKEYLNIKVGKYSGGMKKKLSLLISLIHDPEILILDEPTTGMDPSVRIDVWNLLLKMKREKKVVLLATHYMEEADKLADRVGIIDHGKLLVEGSPEELKKKYGPKTIIVLELYERPENKLDEILSNYSDIFYLEDNTIKIHVDDPDKVLPSLIDSLYRNNFRINTVKITRPSLEDVFLKLTGRRIEENEA